MDDRLSALGITGYQISPPLEGAFADQIKIQNEGVPLWKYFLIAALAFFLMEFLILQLKEKRVATT